MSRFSIGLDYRAAASVSLTATTNSASSLTSYSLAAQAIGAASAERVVFVCVGTRNAGQLASSITIGGISATKAIGATDPSGFNAAEIWYAVVPTGTTATVVINYSVAPPRIGVSVYAAYNLLNGGATTQTGSSSAASPTVSLAPPIHGIAIAYLFGAAAVTVTWAGLTEDVDAQVSSQNYSSASGIYQTATSPATATPSGAMTNPIMVMATFR